MNTPWWTRLWRRVWYGESLDATLEPEERCPHGDSIYLCRKTCRGCGHVCNLHLPDCRDVTQRGTNTRDWYCRCKEFVE